MMNDELEGILDEMDKLIRRAIDAETTCQTIEMLSGMTIEQVVEGFRDGKFDPKKESEVLSQEWISDNAVVGLYPNGIGHVVPAYKLQSLLVPKKELPVVPTWFDEWWKDILKGEGNLFHNIGRFQDELFSFETREAYDYITDQDNKKKLLDIIVNELEYKVEKPLYHALIKGHELADGYDIYWNYDKFDDSVFVTRLHPPHDNFITEMSKSEWNDLGINDSNADFVKVDD